MGQMKRIRAGDWAIVIATALFLAATPFVAYHFLTEEDR